VTTDLFFTKKVYGKALREEFSDSLKELKKKDSLIWV